MHAPSSAILFLANGVEEIEAVTLLDVLRRGNINVQGMTLTSSLQIQGSRNVAFLADTLWDDTRIAAADMLILPGGFTGMENLRGDARIIAALQNAYSKGVWIAALCAAPLVLVHAGLLDGKDATCYPDFHPRLAGAKVHAGKAIVVDGKIITGQGPATAMPFAVELVRILADTGVATKVAKKLLLSSTPVVN